MLAQDKPEKTVVIRGLINVLTRLVGIIKTIEHYILDLEHIDLKSLEVEGYIGKLLSALSKDDSHIKKILSNISTNIDSMRPPKTTLRILKESLEYLKNTTNDFGKKIV